MSEENSAFPFSTILAILMAAAIAFAAVGWAHLRERKNKEMECWTFWHEEVPKFEADEKAQSLKFEAVCVEGRFNLTEDCEKWRERILNQLLTEEQKEIEHYNCQDSEPVKGGKTWFDDDSLAREIRP